MSGDDIALTISSELNLAIQILWLDLSSVVILNYETGEILCSKYTNTYPEM